MAHIELDQAQLAAFCQANQIKKLSIFGSAIRDDFGPGSDIDMLVEFEPSAQVGYFKLVELEIQLTELVGYKVDLRTPGELSPYFRDEVIAQSQVQYAA